MGLQRLSVGSFFMECFFNSDVIKQVTLRLIYASHYRYNKIIGKVKYDIRAASYEFTYTIVMRTDSLETRAKPAVLHNQAILEPIFLYRASKCKQTKEQGSEHCLWTHIFTFL